LRFRPGQLEPEDVRQQAPEVLQDFHSTTYLLRDEVFSQAVGGECPGRLTDVLLDGMQPVATVGDVGGPEVLAGRQQVQDATGIRAPSGIWNGQLLTST
jgi:hypothetical protein